MVESLSGGDQFVLTPDQRALGESVLSTESWRTERILFRPASEVTFTPVERDLLEPEAAREIRIETWLMRLQEKAGRLNAGHETSEFVIEDDVEGESPTNLPALFEIKDRERKRLMYAGTTVSLAQAGVSDENGRLSVPVYPISYSEWIATTNPKFAQAYKEAEFPLPYAGIGISVLMETTDGQIPLTVRGDKTPVYPGRLYSPGGGPKPGQTSTEAILEEILEETGLTQGEDFDLEKMVMLALVSDIKFDGSSHSRPELVAYLPLNVTYEDLERIRDEKAQEQADVWDITSIPGSLHQLSLALLENERQFCPPTEAGLANLVLFKAMRGRNPYSLQTIQQFMHKMKFGKDAFLT